jgi:hypothetical protein
LDGLQVGGEAVHASFLFRTPRAKTPAWQHGLGIGFFQRLATRARGSIIALFFAANGGSWLAALKENAMAHTNRGRVIVGGLVAGLLINIVEYITNGVVLREAWGKAMAALNKPADLSAGAIVIFNVWGFLLGIAAVWVYAAIRPRYGAGPRTAVRAGLATWAFAVFLANLANYPLGLLPARLLVITSIVALVEVVVATLVGAWLYKEEEAQAVRRATA